jgi:hypothetical protein
MKRIKKLQYVKELIEPLALIDSIKLVKRGETKKFFVLTNC